MTSQAATATGMFTLVLMTMGVFLFVWCGQELARFHRIHLARHDPSFSAFERQSEVRGQMLLKDWLTPAQLRSYEKHEYFDAIGSDSAVIYRIHRGTQANVEQLDSVGQPVCGWCFV